MVAENVPPKTISIAGSRNNAPKEPPSKKYAPNIAATPSNNPYRLPEFFNIISSPIKI